MAKCRARGAFKGELAPVVPEGVGWGLLDAHEGLSIQDAVVHVDWVATVPPLSLSLWGQGNTCEHLRRRHGSPVGMGGRVLPQVYLGLCECPMNKGVSG